MATTERIAGGQTPSQTVGPFFHYALPWPGGADLVGRSAIGARLDLVPEGHRLLTAVERDAAEGEVIEIRGRLLDGAGDPVPDALIEIWQADRRGEYVNTRDKGFVGFGRAATDEQGGFLFRTIRPGRAPGPGNSLQAAHIAVGLLGRGLLKRLVTRVYFADGEGLDEDPILRLVAAERRETLLARRQAPGVYGFDIRLQGPDETVFFQL